LVASYIDSETRIRHLPLKLSSLDMHQSQFRTGDWISSPTGYPMKVFKGPQSLANGINHKSSSPILWRYPWTLKSYILTVPSGPSVLYFQGALGSLNPIFWRYPCVLKYSILTVALSPQVLYFYGIFESWSIIFWRYSWALRSYILKVQCLHRPGVEGLWVPSEYSGWGP